MLLALALLLFWLLFSWVLWYARQHRTVFLLFSLEWGATLAAFALTVINISPGKFSWLPFPVLAGATLVGLTTILLVTILCIVRYFFRRKDDPTGFWLAAVVILAGPMVVLGEEPATYFSFLAKVALVFMQLLIILLALLDGISILWQRWRSRGKTSGSEAQLLPADDAHQQLE